MEGLILPNCERLSINLRCREFQKEKKKKKKDTYVCGCHGSHGSRRKSMESFNTSILGN
ncbi:hypothetical protein HanRHA438_Chr11g0511131 [Helianthus annuus]|nr:hypothetical protein HanRHA438_Chr11g0511131 [Helianthus annuus]